jgi:predicted small secreted protein
MKMPRRDAMKKLLSLLLLCSTLLGCGRDAQHGPPGVRGPAPYQLVLQEVVPIDKIPADTVGIMFCMDVSPSMNDRVGADRKMDISKQCIKQVLSQIETYAQQHPKKQIKVGLVAFSGDAEIIKPLEPFQRAELERAVDSLRIGSATAIGTAMEVGARELLRAGVENKALIVLTDGENNRGSRPDWVVDAILQSRNAQQAATDDVKVFLLAFDINAGLFSDVKQAGASVLESRDQASLKNIMTQAVEEVLLEKPN